MAPFDLCAWNGIYDSEKDQGNGQCFEEFNNQIAKLPQGLEVYDAERSIGAKHNASKGSENNGDENFEPHWHFVIKGIARIFVQSKT